MNVNNYLDNLSVAAWKIYQKNVDQSFVVKQSIPILFFGDLEKYFESKLKIITVGLNPSFVEFPVENPSLRFEIENIVKHNNSLYIKTLSEYFHHSPYSRWFGCFEPMLNGMQSSYYPNHINTVLHTDICSPLATNPTWSKLEKSQRILLESDGLDLWHNLVEYLQPDIIVISIARQYLQRIRFKIIEQWKTVYTIYRNNPYVIEMARLNLKGKQVMMLFGLAAQTPFGIISKEDKIKIGSFIRENIYGR
jgi:hypothetical protein